MRRPRGGRALAAFAGAALLGGCAWGGSPGEVQRQGAVVAVAPQPSPEPRVPIAPTSPDSLPAALLGTAPPPQGSDAAYHPADPATRGYLAVPEGTGPFPAVILIHEWDGLNDRVRQVADALAAEGYLALAADLFRGLTGGTPEENRALTQEAQAEEGRIVGNLNAAVRFVRARSDVTGRVAAMGWCFGGGVALSFGLDGDRHEGTAIFYGRLMDDPELLAALDHEVYGTFAAEDRGIPPEAVRGFVAALRQAGVPNDVHIYDDVGHGFWLWADRAPEDRAGPALHAWRRLKAYLQRSLR